MSGSRLEKQKSSLAKAIASLPQGAGSTLHSLNPEIPLWKQERQCDLCGKAIVLQNSKNPLQRFCSPSCSTKWQLSHPEIKARIFTAERAERAGAGRKRFLASGSPEAIRQKERFGNIRPMHIKGIPEKVSKILRQLKVKPPIQGGNGRPMPVPQAKLLALLGVGWKPEVAVPTGGRRPGIPTSYKVDIAHVCWQIAIEVDGISHHAEKVRLADERKEHFLRSKGWTVLRFLNQQILDWIDSGMPTDHFVSTTLKQHDIQVSASKDCSSTIVQ